MSGAGVTAMIVRYPGLRMSLFAALLGGILLAATATAAEPPADRPCQKLTGAERTRCERQNRERKRDETPAPAAEPAEPPPPPPDTKSDGNEQSDTADPPQG
jgi:hypothetical protein